MSKEFLKELYNYGKKIGCINEHFVEHLEKVLPEQSNKILQVIERGITKYIYKPSNRIVWRAIGENDEYLLYPKIFCSCHDFYKNTIIKRKRPFCKHIIAQVISKALNNYMEKELEDNEFPTLIEELKSDF